MNKRILSVGELTSLVKKVLEEEHLLADLWVRAEISNFKKHTSGHMYFSLKDKTSSIRAVMFKSRTWQLHFEPKDGMDCLVRGYVSLFPRDTTVQFYVEEMIPAGVGLQHLALEELKKKLQEKGYFSPQRKRPLPLLPKGIGVVTSPVGAALRDIHQVIQRRYPGMPIHLFPALVQGEKAIDSIIQGVQELGQRDDLDVIIIARGGGSLEDLAVFNGEKLAEVVFHCPKPVISAVGHEIDVTILDLVADARASTPSAGAEMAVPVKKELQQRVVKYQERLLSSVQNRLEREKMRLAFLQNSAVINKPNRWLNPFYEEIIQQEKNLFKNIEYIVGKKAHGLELAAFKLEALSPLAVLKRGYSIAMNKEGRVIFDSRQVENDQQIELKLHLGKLQCLIIGKEDEPDE